MLKKFLNNGQIKYEPYIGIKHTISGLEYVKKIVGCHRIGEAFLHREVGLKWDKIYDGAHKLEHSTSDKLVNKIQKMLDFPEFDPYGGPIHSKDDLLPNRKKTVPLSVLNEDQTGKVVRVNNFHNRFPRYISKIRVKLNKDITVKNVLDFDS